MMPQAMPSRLLESLPENGIRIHAPRTTALAEPPVASSGMRPFAYLKYRWITVVFVGGFLAAALATAAWKLIPSKYTTSSIVRVLNTDPVVHSKEDLQGRNDFAIYLKSQAAMIKSHFVLTAALRDPSVAALPMLREQADPVRFLEEELHVEYQDGSEILKIMLSGDDSRAITQIVNAIHEAYFREVVDAEMTGKKARLRQLEDLINRSQDDVKRRYGQIKQADVDAPETEAVPGLTAQIAANQLVRYKEALGKNEADMRTWENEKATIEKKLSNLADEVTPPPPGYVEALDHDPKMLELSRNIGTWQKKADYLVKISGDEKLASVVEFRQKIADANRMNGEFKKERVAEYQKSQVPIIEQKLKSELERAKSMILQLGIQKQRFDDAVAEMQKTLGQLGPTGDVPQDFQRVDVRERVKIITEMLDKANLLRLEVNAPPRVRDFQRASVPTKRELKKQILGAVIAGLLGFGLVGMCVVFYEARVRRAMSLAEVQKNLLGPIVGVLPARDDTLNADAIAEAVEKTRTLLLQQFARSGSKAVVVTSAIAEEGKAFLACKLAASLQRCGSRTLLMDFDLRSPSLHRHLEAACESGLCEVVTGQVEFHDALQSLPDGLTFIAAGKWTTNVRQALTAERIDAFLQWLRSQYDCIILNTHPMLAVAETYLLCRYADGVLLSVERNESRFPLLLRAQEKLAALSTEALGVVYQGATVDECLN
jgi:capsular exopolysaccharide synthesis family protein